MTLKNISTKKIALIALCVGLNYIGGNIALFLRLPIYLDSIGTIMAAFLLGPIAGMAAGLLSSLLSGITTDLFSLYYIPVALCTGFIAGMVYQRLHKPWRVPIEAAVISLPGTLISSFITYFLFGGITSSGSSIIVQLIHGLGLNQLTSVILVQVITDYADRLLSVVVVLSVIAMLPKKVKMI